TNLGRLFPGPPSGDLNVQVSGQRVRSVNPTPKTCFNGQRDMPFLAAPRQRFTNPDLARMVLWPGVATNGPSSFSIRGGESYLDTPLALFPPDCRHADDLRRPLDFPFAALTHNPEDPAD